MANRKCVADTEANNDEVQRIINKALVLPAKGTHVGGGQHVVMPDTWDGTGPTPPGWTKFATENWVLNASSSWLPVDDSLAALVQGGPAQSHLTGPEIATLAQAIAGRVMADPAAQGAVPKS